MEVNPVIYREVNWRHELFDKTPKELPRIKSLMQSALSFIRCYNDIRFLKTGIKITLEKYEHVLDGIIAVGSIAECIVKVNAVLTKSFWNELFWKFSYMASTALQASVDALLILHRDWKWIDLGNWTKKVGNRLGWKTIPSADSIVSGLKYVKDGLTIVASICNIMSAYTERKSLVVMINKCSKRIDQHGPLVQIQALLNEAKGGMLTAEQLQEIERLKSLHRTKTYQTKVAVHEALKLEITDLAAQKVSTERDDKLAAKREKAARIEVWSQQASVDRLQQVLQYKIDKNRARIENAKWEREKLLAGMWFDGAKIVAIGAYHAVELTGGGSALLLMGRCAANFAAGACGIGKFVAGIRCADAQVKMPQTHLVRV